MKLTRRSVVATALASPLILRSARAADLRARIAVSTENTRGAIDRKIYGNFIEHLGRCIDGGVFQEGSPLSDAAGYRRDVYPLQLFAKNALGNSLRLDVEVPSYDTKQWNDVPYLDVSGSIDGNTLVLNVVNRHKDEAVDTTIALDDKSFAGALGITEVNGPDIKASNDFGRTDVRAQSRTANARGNTVQHRFPAHSFTQLKVQLS